MVHGVYILFVDCRSSSWAGQVVEVARVFVVENPGMCDFCESKYYSRIPSLDCCYCGASCLLSMCSVDFHFPVGNYLGRNSSAVIHMVLQKDFSDLGVAASLASEAVPPRVASGAYVISSRALSSLECLGTHFVDCLVPHRSAHACRIGLKGCVVLGVLLGECSGQNGFGSGYGSAVDDVEAEDDRNKAGIGGTAAWACGAVAVSPSGARPIDQVAHHGGHRGCMAHSSHWHHRIVPSSHQTIPLQLLDLVALWLQQV